jgi:hypothetical protein
MTAPTHARGRAAVPARRAMLVAAPAIVAAFLFILAGSRPASAASTNFDCWLDQVGTFADRVFARCQLATAGVYIFAYPTTNAPQAARILNVLTTVALGEPHAIVTITFDPADVSGAAIGCPASDCRLIQAVHVK